MDRKRRRQRLALTLILILIVISLIGEAMSDRKADICLGVAVLGVACLVIGFWVGVAFLLGAS